MAALLVSALFLYLCFRWLLPIALPFLVAWLLAALLHRPVCYLKRKLRVPRTLSSLVGLLLLLSLLGTAGFFLFRALFTQLMALVREFPTWETSFSMYYQSFCQGCDRFLRLETGASRIFLDSQLDRLFAGLQASVLPSLTEQSLRFAIGTVQAFALLVIVLVVAVLLVRDLDEYRTRLRASSVAPVLLPILSRLRYSAISYLRTQGIILLITFVLCTLGLFLIGNPYALLLGLVIALLDALPVLGSGMVLLPWSALLFFQRHYSSGGILLGVFLLCAFLRQFLEPKLLGKGIGIRPLPTLLSMYLGIRLFGVAGFLLGPVGLIILKTVWDMTELV